MHIVFRLAFAIVILSGITATYPKAAEQSIKSGEKDSSPQQMVNEGVKLTGRFFREVSNDEGIKAAALFQKAADMGNIEASYWLGRCYINGIGVEKDQVKGFNLLKEASDKGHLPALHYLARYYLRGTGTEKDEKAAVLLFEKSAENNDKQSQRFMGDFNYHGLGEVVPVDKKKAFYWHSRAAEKGWSGDALRMADYYIKGIGGVEKSPEKVLEIIQSVATLKDYFARETQEALGVAYLFGILNIHFIIGTAGYDEYETTINYKVNPFPVDIKKAIHYLELTHQNKPDEFMSTMLLAIAYQKNGQINKAFEMIKSTFNTQKGSAISLFLICVIFGLLIGYGIELYLLIRAAKRFRKSAGENFNCWKFSDTFILLSVMGIWSILGSFIFILFPGTVLTAALFSTALIFGVCLFTFAVILHFRGVSVWKAFGLNVATPWKTAAKWLTASVICVFTVDIAYAAFSRFCGWNINKQLISKLLKINDLQNLDLAIVITMGAFVIPILEEMIFRGIIYQSILSKFKPWIAILVSAIIFAGAHMEPAAMFPIFLMGIVFAYLVHKTGSLRLSIALHCLNNLVALLVAVAAK